MFIGTANCAKAATTTATTKEHRRWMEWEKNSGLVFQRPWSAIMLKFRELHDTLFKEQRRVGMPFKAAFRALFPIAEEEGIGGANQHRYNFATFNCASNALNVSTSRSMNLCSWYGKPAVAGSRVNLLKKLIVRISL